jgi:hypothetical protein
MEKNLHCYRRFPGLRVPVKELTGGFFDFGHIILWEQTLNLHGVVQIDPLNFTIQSPEIPIPVEGDSL